MRKATEKIPFYIDLTYTLVFRYLHTPVCTHLLLKLRASVLQRVRPLLEVPELAVPLQHVLHVLVHDPDHLVHLGLLLRHLPGRLDLPDLGRPRDRLSIRTQRPRGLRINILLNYT